MLQQKARQGKADILIFRIYKIRALLFKAAMVFMHAPLSRTYGVRWARLSLLSFAAVWEVRRPIVTVPRTQLPCPLIRGYSEH